MSPLLHASGRTGLQSSDKLINTIPYIYMEQRSNALLTFEFGALPQIVLLPNPLLA